MAVFGASDELKALVGQHEELIKADYFTLKLFVDSAVRDKLRRMGVAGVGDDEIVAHLDRLKASKARHLSQQALIHKRNNHKRRIARIHKELNEDV